MPGALAPHAHLSCRSHIPEPSTTLRVESGIRPFPVLRHREYAEGGIQNVLNSTVPSASPLMAELVPLSVLRAEYEGGSDSFVKQIDFLLAQGWEGVRRSRGDGDCFYRCVCSEGFPW